MNETVRRLSQDFRAQTAVAQELKKLGLTRFISLSRSFNQSRIALALYAGNGIVAKVIPADYLGERHAIYHLPAITKSSIHTDDREFRVKTYPWLSPENVTQEDVDKFHKKLKGIGLSFSEGDDQPKNVHRMPDKNRTLIGIDSSMYHISPDNKITPDLENAWHRYTHLLFPIYDETTVLHQSDDTDFSFVSIHDRESGVIGFDHTLEDPVILEQNTSLDRPKTRPLWRRIFSLG